jgi:hypothetical protein
MIIITNYSFLFKKEKYNLTFWKTSFLKFYYLATSLLVYFLVTLGNFPSLPSLPSLFDMNVVFMSTITGLASSNYLFGNMFRHLSEPKDQKRISSN